MLGSPLPSRYRIDSELGRGGMGVVYRAHATLLDRPVVIKVLSSESLGTEGRARRIKAYTVLARYSGSPHFLAVGRRVQGQILAALESWDEAAASFDKAVAMLDRLGGRLEGLLETMAARVT